MLAVGRWCGSKREPRLEKPRLAKRVEARWAPPARWLCSAGRSS